MHESVEKLIGKVIVSCQAYEDTPLYGSEHMVAMAQSALLGGAAGIRACWPQDIKAIRRVCDKPIIGIYKEFSKGDPLDEVFITPTFQRAKEVIEAGADIVALDCTIRDTRPLTELIDLLSEIRETFPKIAIMADIATLQEGKVMADCGLVDIISTTLNGYTRNSLHEKKEGPNINIIKALKEYTNVQINGEGRIWTIEDMKEVLEAGADMVCIGSAITRPHLITERFVSRNKDIQHNKKLP